MACPAQQIAPDPMSPGTYLRKRREAARLGIRQAAATLAVLGASLGRGRATRADDRMVSRLSLRLVQAEDDELPFPTDQVGFLANVFPIDAQVYSRLVALHYAGPRTSTSSPRRILNDAAALVDLPVPRTCRRCACSANDACVDDRGACAWSARDPGLCTCCTRKEAAASELCARHPHLVLVAEREPPQRCFAYWDGEAMICTAARSGNCCGNPPAAADRFLARAEG